MIPTIHPHPTKKQHRIQKPQEKRVLVPNQTNPMDPGSPSENGNGT